MKVAVYTIARDEEKNAEAFMESCHGADLVLVGDTGSTDRTKEIIENRGGKTVDVTIFPWRFDLARNVVMALLPEDIDICIALDLDEQLSPNWRAVLNAQWDCGEHNRLKFRYVHNFKANGDEGTVGVKDFAHGRFHWVWKHRVHEKLYYEGGDQNVLTTMNITVAHRQDPHKQRANYLELLEQECADPSATTAQHLFWLAREYLYADEFEKAVDCFDWFLLRSDTWVIEKAHAYRLKAKAVKTRDDARVCLLNAYATAPNEREIIVDLAWFYYKTESYAAALGCMEEAFKITNRPEHYLTSNSAWDHTGYMIAAHCAKELGLIDKAKEYTTIAYKISPDSEQVIKMTKELDIAG